MFKKMLVLLLVIGMVGFAGNVLADSQASVDNVTAGSSLSTVDNSHSNIYNRQFVNSGMTPIPNTNGFFVAPTPDSSFRKAQDLIFALTGDPNAISVRLTEGALENLAKGGDVESNVQVIRENLATAKADENGVKWLTLSIITPILEKQADGKMKVVGLNRDPMKVGAMGDGEADDADTNSFMVIGSVGLKAIKAGFNHLEITAEGAHRGVFASGWGIGTYVVGGTVNDSGKDSALGGGGLGYAANQTGAEDKPWIQGNVGISE
jgi:hypothetical protein